tara:strand:- start:38 stop:769 length:732 start_codon:yes stop_codon:yes gene_type:complete
MIVANWKNKGSKELIKAWVDSVSQDIDIIKGKDCVFCPPTCYLDYAKDFIKQTNKDIKIGSQELDSELTSPLTGAISSQMLADLGCEFVIIGHSEQRLHFKESNEILSNKLLNAIERDIVPIFCVGETKSQKDTDLTKKVLSKQLDAIQTDHTSKCIIAYEPVWAIGTGDYAEISLIEKIHAYIKEYIMNKTKSSNQISVVYGGSVNLENYKEIYSSNQVDGLLIGGASLDANTFTEIYNMSQ